MDIPYSLAGDSPSATSPSVAISVLGTFRLTVGSSLLTIDGESKSAHLLLCLVLAQEHCLLRAQLLEYLWPEAEPTLACQSLHSLVHHLHKLTKNLPDGVDLVVYKNGYYQLNTEGGVWIDLDQFEAWGKQGKRLLTNGDVSAGVAYYQKALDLYKGDLCGGADLQSLLERERLRTLYLDLLFHLADHYYTSGDYTEALQYLQRMIAHDPCREDAHRQAMRCYMELNQRAQALRQYRLCCQMLALEFDVEPEPASVALFEQIRLDPASLTVPNGDADAA